MAEAIISEPSVCQMVSLYIEGNSERMDFCSRGTIFRYLQYVFSAATRIAFEKYFSGKSACFVML